MVLNLAKVGKMKKFITTFVIAIMLGIMIPMFAETANAQTRYVRRNGRLVRVYHKRSFYKKHRNKLNVAMGVGAGALVGGLIGGKRGAGVGMLAGGGGAALYTYKLRKKHRRVRNY